MRRSPPRRRTRSLSLAGSTQNVVIAGGLNDLIDLTGNSGARRRDRRVGDTIVAGGGTTNIEGVAGGMQIVVGAGGTTNISGSGVPGLGNTVIGGAGEPRFQPERVAGQGDLIDLSGSTGTATINAFAFGATRIASHDTILAANNADLVFGGDGDRIGTGNGSVVGGTASMGRMPTRSPARRSGSAATTRSPRRPTTR